MFTVRVFMPRGLNLGQNVNSYGKNLDRDINFSKLLRQINDLPGDFIIRFMTSHPKDCTKELIDTMAECDKVAKHLHLPFQSGNDRVLGSYQGIKIVINYKQGKISSAYPIMEEK